MNTVVLNHRNAISLILTAALSAGCSDDGQTTSGGATEGSDQPLAQPGYLIECTPDISGDQIACMSHASWECPIREHYIRESICAHFWGGTPADYNNRPLQKSNDLVDCANYPVVGSPGDTILNGWNWGGENMEIEELCTDCRVCNNQIAGWWEDLGPEGAWNEFAWCPGKAETPPPESAPYPNYDALTSFCDGSPATTGEDPTTGGDPTAGSMTAGDPPPSGIWICTGSPTICGTMIDTFPPQTMDTRCMAPGNIPDCVTATESTAQNKCHDLCLLKNQSHADEADLSPTKTWDPPFPCDTLNTFTPVEAINPQLECSGGGPMALENPLPFAATAALSLGDGSATSDQLNGIIDFSTGACPPGTAACDVTLTDLFSTAKTVRGIYTTRNEQGGLSSMPFAISDLEVRLVQPVRGTLNPRMGLVSFPDDDMFVRISSGLTTLANSPLSSGVDDVVFAIDGARGTLRDGKLTLDLNWSAPGMSLWLRITAD